MPPLTRRRTLDRMLSHLGVCSRGSAAELARAGRLRRNGRVLRRCDVWIDPEDRLELDGRPLTAAPRLYLALNKPKGFLTTLYDPRGRRTVYDLLEHLPAWVFPVGRLDRDTSGLLLFTNDSDFAERVTDPAFGIPKLYRVTTRRRVEEAELAPLSRGIELEDGPALPTRARLVGHRGPTSVVELELREGRKRQVRRMFLALGKPVKDLRRIAIGPVQLGSLASGATRELTAGERQALLRAGQRASDQRPSRKPCSRGRSGSGRK
jgi:pseudouridine synthase